MRSIAQAALVIVTACALHACNARNEAASEQQEITLANVEKEAATAFKPVDAGSGPVANGLFEQKELNTFSDSAGTPGDKQQPPQQKRTTAGGVIAVRENWDRKIIKTADIRAEVKDNQAFYANLREKVSAIGGYIASEEQKQNDYSIENDLVIKVPVDQFDNALAGLNTGIISLLEKKVRSQDVTAEMVDTRSRLETKKKVRQRYGELLTHAKNVEEMFTVEKEINQIQEDIEAADGRLTYLGHSAAYSTINYTYFQVLNASMKDKDDPGFMTKLKEAFSTGWSWVSGLFLGLISVWPVWLLIGGLFLIVKRRFSRLKTS
jgi:hypothetical protein